MSSSRDRLLEGTYTSVERARSGGRGIVYTYPLIQLRLSFQLHVC
jgi:hypothetical protein